VAHTLSIDRLVSTYLVSRDHPAPEEVRRELDDVVRKHIADSCGRALSTLLDTRDPSVWLIDRIAVDVLMDLSAAETEGVAAFWAGKIAESVAKTIAQGEDGGRVMRFANRAEFLAYFLRDLADGAAWGKWYFRQFESLRSLPTAAAIREAMFREPDHVEAALLHLLRTNRLSGVAGLLSEADQKKLVQLCSGEEVTPRKEIFEAVFKDWRSAAIRLLRPLDLYLKVRDRHPEYPPAEVRSAVRHVLTVEQWGQSSQLDTILAAVVDNRLSAVHERFARAEQETLLYLSFVSSEDPAWPGRLAEIEHDPEDTCRFASPWGGIFLLLPALIANRDLMAAFGSAEDAVLRYLLFGACLPMYSAESVLDRALAVAAGFETTPEPYFLQQPRAREGSAIKHHDLLPEDLKYIDAAGETWGPGIALESALRNQLVVAGAVLLRSFARGLPGLGQSSFDYVWRNILSGDAVITVSPGRVLVELAPRPLEIVLHMGGFHEMRFIPPWMAETEVVVRCERQ
jgi:hypothetical protein